MLGFALGNGWWRGRLGWAGGRAYYGDELGMENVPVPPEREQDPFGKNMPGVGQGRDPERTPMRWDTSENAGFTTGEPWLPLGDDTPLSVQVADPTSMLSLHRALLALRRTEPALAVGAIRGVAANGAVLSFERVHQGRRLAVLANMGSDGVAVRLPSAELLLSSALDREGDHPEGPLTLRPDEAVIARLR